MNTVKISSPAMPYWGRIPGNLFPGKVIDIKGVFPVSIDTSSFCKINLCEGSEEIIALHLSIRFNHREVVRNSFKSGRWEAEEKGGPFPFELGSQFWIQIAVQPDAYHISVNGQQCWTFRHRMPFLNVNSIAINGPFHLFEVEFANQNEMYHPGTGSYQPSIPLMEPVHNPPIPYNQIISGGIQPGIMIYISGIPLPNFYRFTVNLQCGSAPYPPPDIAFHFDARAFSSTVVRNTRRDDQWGPEETVAPNFPFQPNVPFDMIILVQNDKYMVAINGQHFIEYAHRMTRFSVINTLRIESDINITSIKVARSM